MRRWHGIKVKKAPRNAKTFRGAFFSSAEFRGPRVITRGYRKTNVAAAVKPWPAGRNVMLIKMIITDVRAKAGWLYGETGRRAFIKALFTDGTFAMIVYRLMQSCRRRTLLRPAAMFWGKLNGWLGRCIIGRGANFGPGFVLIHSDGIVINTAVRGGSNVKLEHRVTIGAEKGVAPQLGDDVFVGAGAVIVGPVTIGNHTRIGANAVVTHDVPDGATAIGVPARIVRREEARNGN